MLSLYLTLYGDSNTMTLLEATTISGSWAKYEDVNGMPVGTSTNGPTQALELLDSYTKSWKNVNDITYQMGVTKFFGNAFTKCNGNGCTSNEYVWSNPRTVKARMITVHSNFCEDSSRIIKFLKSSFSYFSKLLSIIITVLVFK